MYVVLFGMSQCKDLLHIQEVVLPEDLINVKIAAIVLISFYKKSPASISCRALIYDINMKNLISLLLMVSIFALAHYACMSKHGNNSVDEINYEKCFYLKENIDICGEFNSICFLDESRFVVSTKINPSIFIYDETGLQLLQIDKRGNGPFEYINPAIVRCDKNRHIYVWCSMTLKMIIFDENGTPLNEYRFPYAIKDFLPYKNYLFLYLAGGAEHIIDVYDMTNFEIITSIGTATEEHKLLNINAAAGGITLLNDSVIFARTDKPDIELCDMNYATPIFETKTYKANDKSFSVEPLNGLTTVDLMNSNHTKAIEYISRNSVTNGLFITKDNVILKAKSGTVDIKNGEVINNSRFDVLYIFNKNLDYLYEQKYICKNEDFFVYDNLYVSNGKDIFFLATNNTKEESRQYSLNRLFFSQKAVYQE
jgi:hypothetical protein